MDVLIGVVRNSKAAWRNRSAPNLTAASVFPNAAMSSSTRLAASESSVRSVKRGSVAAAGSRSKPARVASTTKASKGTRTALLTAGADATIARCRRNVNRSSARVPTPAIQYCSVSVQTSNSLATSAGLSPCCSLERAANTTSALVIFPGSTSQGRTRSRRLQRRHRESTIQITRYPESAFSLRITRLPVSRGLGAEQREQRQAASWSSTQRASARRASYSLECTSST